MLIKSLPPGPRNKWPQYLHAPPTLFKSSAGVSAGPGTHSDFQRWFLALTRNVTFLEAREQGNDLLLLFFNPSHAAGAWTPRCLHPPDGSCVSGGPRLRGSQQKKAQAGRPRQRSPLRRHCEGSGEQRCHQRGLQSSALQRLSGPWVASCPCPLRWHQNHERQSVSPQTGSFHMLTTKNKSRWVLRLGLGLLWPCFSVSRTFLYHCSAFYLKKAKEETLFLQSTAGRARSISQDGVRT